MRSNEVPQLLALAALTFAAAFGLQGVLLSAHESWSDPYGPFSHGYLIVGLAGWLAWVFWRRQPPRMLAPWPWALVAIGFLTASLIVAERLGINTARQMLLPLFFLACVATVLGREAARTLLWPAAFVYFALPMWWVMNGFLQELTTVVARFLVSVSHIPAFIEGNSFQLPAGVVEIASGCSGLNYLVVALALSSFQGLLYLRSWPDRLRLCAAGLVVGLISNWLRVYLLILIAYATDMQHYLIRVDHLYFGWVLFLLWMWPVFRYGSRLEQRQSAPTGAARNSVPLVPTGPAAGSQIVLVSVSVGSALLLIAPRLLAVPPVL